MRVPLVAANWKMHKTAWEARTYLKRLLDLVPPEPGVELAVFPSFPLLPEAARALRGSPVRLGAQNVHPEPAGAYTGEVSVLQLAELGVRYVLCGHSERRKLFFEDDRFVGRKVRAVSAAGLAPILCVGETLEERKTGRAWPVVEGQLALGLEGLGSPGGLVVAYEPVWAIGTGVAAHPADAREMAARIRAWLRDRFGEGSEGVRIQYGGSVKPENAGEFLRLPELDGALVGGASLDPDAFWAIAQTARR